MTTANDKTSATRAGEALGRIPFGCTLGLLDIIAWVFVVTHITAINRLLEHLVK
jgi:hypothetical protein